MRGEAPFEKGSKDVSNPLCFGEGEVDASPGIDKGFQENSLSLFWIVAIFVKAAGSA